MASKAARHAYLTVVVVGALSILALSLLLLNENRRLDRQTDRVARHVLVQCQQAQRDRFLRLRIADTFERSPNHDLNRVASDLRELAGPPIICV